MKKIPLIIISGATASGKTELAIKIAKHLNTEIISADSMQIYKGIKIASAQPSESELFEVKHHLINFLPIDSEFSVVDFCNEAKKIIERLNNEGKIPVIVGGTGLYLNSLCDDIEFTDCGDDDIRNRLYSEAEKMGNDYLFERLKSVDAQSAQKIDKNNTRRIVRALEVYEVTGKPFSEISRLQKPQESPYNVIWFNISFENRDILYDRINKRVDSMVSAGLIEEARQYRSLLKENGSAQAIGHKEIYPYLDGIISLDEAIENLKTATRHYAKRQITWFKKREGIINLYKDKEDIFEKALKIIDETEV